MTFRTMQWQSLGQSLRVRAAMSLSSVCLLLPNSSDGSPRPRRRAAPITATHRRRRRRR